MRPYRWELKDKNLLMEIPDLYGSVFDCSCGTRHKICPEKVIYDREAVDALPSVLAGFVNGTSVAVFEDERTKAVVGSEIVKKLQAAGWTVVEKVVPDTKKGQTPVCDDVTLTCLESETGRLDTVVAAGSGVISDLAKWFAYNRGIPYLCFATAASMNGYASANVAPTLQGIKSLIRAAPPKAVLASPDIIRDAPWRMTAAGLGDLLAKSVSAADWYLNHFLFGDYYCEKAVNIIQEIEPYYLDQPAEVRNRLPETLEAMFHALLLTGVAMTMAETSSPSSGGEHMPSHALDMLSALDGHPHDLHGRQVGIGTVLAAEVYYRLLQAEKPPPARIPASVDKRYWGRLAETVEEHYKGKSERLQQLPQLLEQQELWEALRGKLSDVVRSPATVHACLVQAGAASTTADIGCSRERIVGALNHGHEIRSRVTVLDLAQIFGILPEEGAEIVDMWAVAQ